MFYSFQMLALAHNHHRILEEGEEEEVEVGENDIIQLNNHNSVIKSKKRNENLETNSNHFTSSSNYHHHHQHHHHQHPVEQQHQNQHQQQQQNDDNNIILLTQSNSNNNNNNFTVNQSSSPLMSTQASRVMDGIGIVSSCSSLLNPNNYKNTSCLPSHIVGNYSILVQEITSPLNDRQNDNNVSLMTLPMQDSIQMATTTAPTINIEIAESENSNLKKTKKIPKTKKAISFKKSSKELATCQFCGQEMLKKNIPTHIRRVHTPKEELVCLNEEQNIFTFHHLKPGQRRRRATRAYDYNLMTTTFSIEDINDSCEGIENKFITEGQEILSTDLAQLSDRIKYAISQIPDRYS
jgi:hypothetical protein